MITVLSITSSAMLDFIKTIFGAKCYCYTYGIQSIVHIVLSKAVFGRENFEEQFVK